MTRLKTILLTALLLWPAPAMAQTTSVGDRLSAIINDITGPLILLLSIGCLVGGMWMLARGLLKLKDASGGNEQTGSALITIVAAVALIALPEMAGVGMITMSNTGGIIDTASLKQAQANLDNTGGGANGFRFSTEVTPPEDCMSHDEPVPCMAANVANNVVPIGIIATFVIVFIAGAWGFGGALFEIARNQQGRGMPEGIWGKIIFSIMLMNAPFIFQIVTQTVIGRDGTVGGDGLVGGHSFLSYDTGVGDQFAQYEALIGYVFVILALFGAIAFVRGIFVMKSASTGRGNGSFGHGIVFMVAGILLANAKVSTCTVLWTLGVQATGGSTAFGFC